MRKIYFTLLLTALCTAACTEKAEVSPAVPQLQKIIEEGQKSLIKVDEDIKANEADAVKVANLIEEKELLKSRIARAKKQLHVLDPHAEATPAASGGGHH